MANFLSFDFICLPVMLFNLIERGSNGSNGLERIFYVKCQT